jgi:dipeptidyl aminopeptidase/acylaminoacyl peptidase
MYWASVPFDTSVREYDPRTGQVGEALCDSSSMERVPHLSPNGRTLAFVSNREGRTNIWTCDLETQAVTAVTRYPRAGTWMPRWSPDASMLAFRLAEQNGPWRVAIWRRGQSMRMITPSNLSVSHFSWAPDSQTLHFLARAEDTPRHYTVRVDGSALQDLGDTGATEIDVRADGQIWLRQNAELILWDRSTGARRVFPAPKATLWGLDQDRMTAFLTVKAVPGLYGLEAVLFREGQSPRKVAPANVPRTMGWHPGPNGRLYAVQHEPVDGDIYRSAPIP